jgi:hypothetical protein
MHWLHNGKAIWNSKIYVMKKITISGFGNTKHQKGRINMGTNYYFVEKEAKKFLDNFVSMFQEDVEVPMLHIGKASCGWKGLLKRNENFYKTVQEMKKFYERNKDKIIIMNEYHEEVTWEELEEKLLDRQGMSLESDYIDDNGHRWAGEHIGWFN